jgi:hypothetical protein
MNKINKLIYEYIDENIDVFIKNISDDYNINYTEIKNKWINFIDVSNKDNFTKNIISIVEPGETQIEVKETQIEVKETKRDVKETKRDVKETKRDVKETKKEKVEDIKIKETKREDKETKKDVKKVWEDSEDDDGELVIRKKTKTPVYSGVLIRFNKLLKKYIHKDSRMVFYSKNELIVYCKLSDDNKLYELTDEDKETCKKLKFRFDPCLYDEKEVQRIYEENNEE